MCIRAVSREESGKVLSSCRSIDSDPRFIPVTRKVYANKHYYCTTKLDFSYNFIYFLLSLFAVFILQLLRNMVKRFFLSESCCLLPRGKAHLIPTFVLIGILLYTQILSFMREKYCQLLQLCETLLCILVFNSVFEKVNVGNRI